MLLTAVARDTNQLWQGSLQNTETFCGESCWRDRLRDKKTREGLTRMAIVAAVTAATLTRMASATGGGINLLHSFSLPRMSSETKTESAGF